MTKLWTPIAVASHLSTLPDNRASASASFDNTVLHLTMTDQAQVLYSGTATLFEIALWVAGPPLVLWLVWLLSRPRPAQMGGLTAQAIRRVDLYRRANALNQPNELNRADIAGSRPANTPVPRSFDQRR